jgi:hypothetical protein
MVIDSFILIRNPKYTSLPGGFCNFNSLPFLSDLFSHQFEFAGISFSLDAPIVLDHWMQNNDESLQQSGNNDSSRVDDSLGQNASAVR